MMKLALVALSVVQVALGFQQPSALQARVLSNTALTAYRYDNQYMYEDGQSSFGGRSNDWYGGRYKSYEGTLGRSIDSFGARVPYDSYDAYSGVRTFAPDQPGDNTVKRGRRLHRFQDVYYGNNNRFGYNNGYNNYGPSSYERRSYAYSAPARGGAVRADGTLGGPLSRYGGGGYGGGYNQGGYGGGFSDGAW